jgi:glycosyltransferase involved in cell wall biosynthesis
MRLSIVIPARNEEDNLSRLLQSIAASTVLPTEVLLMDDASTDNTALIAQNLGATVITPATLPANWTPVYGVSEQHFAIFKIARSYPASESLTPIEY